MKKIKGIVSIILVATMLCAVFSAMGSASAVTAEVNPAQETVVETNVPDNVQDGVILHAFCWGYSEIEKNLEYIARAGYTAIQTSPVQQPKDMCASTNVSGQWWKLYQPASLSIADNSWLGTKEELTSLCKAAEKYGIKIICDIVSNHLGSNSDDQVGFYGLAVEVENYEPQIWKGDNAIAYPGNTRDNPYIHQDFNTTTDTDAKTVTQRMSGNNLPDLNTGNKYVQESVADLLKECIDCGVDGFRFDAAKHIETPDDGDVASDYWPTILGAAREYAASKGQEIYTYGEILNTPGGGRTYSSYTKHGLSITDNRASSQTLGGVTGKNPKGAAVGNYGGTDKETDMLSAKEVLLWAESHDTYFNNSVTTDIPNEDIIKTWAMVASRKDATALYFPRPTSMKMGAISVDASYKSVTVAEVNKFHNECVGEEETLGSDDNFAYVVRGQKGIVIVNVAGNTNEAAIAGTGLADGEYKDMITGNKFTVANGTVSGTVGSTGVAVVTKGETTPTAYTDKESCTFNGETITLKLSLSNATSGTFSLDGCAPIEFTDSTIKIGKGYEYGETITLTLTATDGTKTTKTVYEYVKKPAATSGVYLMLNAEGAVINGVKWTKPMYCYIYDECNDEKNEYKKTPEKVYSNDAWPGQEMEYDEALGCYYIQIQDNYCVESNNGKVVDTNCDFNLATSSQTRVIFSDSSAKSSASGGTSAGKQFPMSGDGLKVNGKTHELLKTYSYNARTDWVEKDIIPGYKERVYATEVNKDGSIVIPSYTIGDVNYSESVDVNDATAIQQHLADLKALECGINVADTNADGRVSIMDVTYIQRKIANIEGYGKVGEVVQGDEGDIPGTEKPSVPSTEPTDPPTTAPAETYTAYVSSPIPWLEDSGCGVYIFDKKTGESYFMTKDTTKYPNVFTAEVPVTCSDVIIYRALAPVSDPANDSGSAYNIQNTTLSKVNNCYYWETESSGYAGAYVEQQKPTEFLERVYVDNSAAKWSEVYVYGWGYGLNNTTHAMTNISGTDIWYIDLPQGIPDGMETFLFKDTAGGDNWVKQSGNVKVQLPNNCYKLSTSSGPSAYGTWSTYNG